MPNLYKNKVVKCDRKLPIQVLKQVNRNVKYF